MSAFPHGFKGQKQEPTVHTSGEFDIGFWRFDRSWAVL